MYSFMYKTCKRRSSKVSIICFCVGCFNVSICLPTTVAVKACRCNSGLAGVMDVSRWMDVRSVDG